MSTGPNIRMLQPGEYLCFQGQPSDEIYVLRAGKLDIYVVDANDVVSQEKVESEGMLVGSVETPNTFIGEIGAILKEPRSASIKCAIDAQIMVIDLRGKGFEASILQNPKLGLGLSRTIAGRINQTTNNMIKSETLSNQVTEYITSSSQKFFEVFSAVQKIAEAAQAEVPFLNEVKESYGFQIGKIASKYGVISKELLATMELPYKAFTNMFVNRIYAGGAAGNIEVPSGEPKPGVAAFPPGTVVCAPGTLDERLYILLAGKLEVFAGSRTIEIIQTKGAMFGETALFGEPRTNGIRTITEVHAMPIPRDKIEPFLMAKPQVMLFLLRMLAKRLPLLNEALLNTAQGMTALTHIFGACLNGYEAMAPRAKTELAVLGDAVAPLLKDLEDSIHQVSFVFNEIQGKYAQLCSEIGYRPKEDGDVEIRGPRVTMPQFPFVAKIEQLEELDSEHINFALNPKTDAFRACSIEFSHQDMLTLAKVPKDGFKDFLFGRIINFGESFPSQFVCFDITSNGLAKHDIAYAVRTLQVMLQKMEQEIFLVYEGNDMNEACLVSDYIKQEGDDLVDEATIQEFIDKFKKEPDNRDILDKLNALYWDLIIATIQKKLSKVKETTVEFEDSERNLINFGLLDPKFLPDNSTVLDQIAEDKTFKPPEDTGLRFIYLEDIVQDVYKEAFGYNKLDLLNKQNVEIRSELKAVQDRLAVLAKARIDMITSFPGGAAAAAFAQKLDAIIKTNSVLDRTMKAGRQLNTQQRAQVVALKNNRTALTNQLSGFFTAIKGKVSEEKVKEFRDYGDEYEAKCMEDLIMQEKLAAHDAVVKQHQADMKAITVKLKEITYKNEIVRLKKYVLLTAKKSQVDPTAVLVNVREIATRKRVAEIMQLFLSENVDPIIFDPKLPRIKKMGNPDVLLIPGSGVAVYDWEKHLFLVPLSPPKTLEESVANAFVEFHWDMDEDKSLRTSYGEIKIYKKLSITKLKSQLTKDYVTWATKEAKGWRMLDKEVRPWFQTKIGKIKAKKDAPAEGG